MDASGNKGRQELPAPNVWPWERFNVVKVDGPKPYVRKLKPGMVVALHSKTFNRYVRMSPTDMDRSGVKAANALPPANVWPWERFTVVDGGSGQIALHSKTFNRYLRMNPNKDVDRSGTKGVNDLPAPNVWPWERFYEVDGQDGSIALWSPTFNRYVRMTPTRMDASANKGRYQLPAPGVWPWERFNVVKVDGPKPYVRQLKPGMIVALHSPTFNRFVRMNGNDMDRSGVKAAKDIPPYAQWPWERFTVVDGGNGQIALHSPHFNRYVRMNPNTDVDLSSVKGANELPAPGVWPWERFYEVDGQDGSIALWS